MGISTFAANLETVININYIIIIVPWCGWNMLDSKWIFFSEGDVSEVGMCNSVQSVSNFVQIFVIQWFASIWFVEWL